MVIERHKNVMEERKCKIIRNAIDINRNRLPYYLWDEYFTILEERENLTTVKHGLRKWVFENKYIKKV